MLIALKWNFTVAEKKTLQRGKNVTIWITVCNKCHSKGDQSWVFFGKNDAKAETPVLWPPHAKSWLIGKDSDAGRDGEQEEKGTTEDEMAGWHHRLNGREFKWTPGDGDGQGGLACCDSWGPKSRTRLSDWTELNKCPQSHWLWHREHGGSGCVGGGAGNRLVSWRGREESNRQREHLGQGFEVERSLPQLSNWKETTGWSKRVQGKWQDEVERWAKKIFILTAT